MGEPCRRGELQDGAYPGKSIPLPYLPSPRHRPTQASYTLNGEVPEGDIDLKAPSGYSSGIKVHLDAPIDMGAAESMEILVDFDVEQNFVVQGSEVDMDIKGVIFTPTLKEKERSQQSS